LGAVVPEVLLRAPALPVAVDVEPACVVLGFVPAVDVLVAAPLAVAVSVVGAPDVAVPADVVPADVVPADVVPAGVVPAGVVPAVVVPAVDVATVPPPSATRSSRRSPTTPEPISSATAPRTRRLSPPDRKRCGRS